LPRVSAEAPGKRILEDDPVAIELLVAIRGGDLPVVRRLLRDEPELATTRFVAAAGAPALHCTW
jgi:hypothetical protein